jgi:hypothetical protein
MWTEVPNDVNYIDIDEAFKNIPAKFCWFNDIDCPNQLINKVSNVQRCNTFILEKIQHSTTAS